MWSLIAIPTGAERSIFPTKIQERHQCAGNFFFCLLSCGFGISITGLGLRTRRGRTQSLASRSVRNVRFAGKARSKGGKVITGFQIIESARRRRWTTVPAIVSMLLLCATAASAAQFEAPANRKAADLAGQFVSRELSKMAWRVSIFIDLYHGSVR